MIKKTFMAVQYSVVKAESHKVTGSQVHIINNQPISAKHRKRGSEFAISFYNDRASDNK